MMIYVVCGSGPGSMWYWNGMITLNKPYTTSRAIGFRALRQANVMLGPNVRGSVYMGFDRLVD